MSLKLNSSGGGSVTLQEPTTASNVTLSLPAADATVLTDSAGVLNIGSGQVYKDASGNVGIGTSSPSSYAGLTVFKYFASGGQNYSVRFSDTINSTFWVGHQSGLTNLITDTAMAFYTSSTERARIDTSGNLMVGTTTAYGQITSQSSSAKFQYAAHNTDASGTSQISFRFVRNTADVGSIQTTSSATSYVTSSDYRLKENVQPMTGALTKVAALKPCIYTWKADGSAGEGFVAHELAEVCPQAVAGEKDAVNEDGSIKPQGIDTSFLVATLTAAIQELKAEVDALRAQVEAQ